MLKPAASASASARSAEGTEVVSVSNHESLASSRPPARRPAAAIEVSRWTRSAMRVRPSRPCHAAYSPAMFANRTWAVQMLEVAFSRRMCCSRVCSASRRAGRPSVSTLTPTMRPGIERAARSWAARKPACGPPKPIGTPNRCAEPTAMSAPNCPGGTASRHANGSVATTAIPPSSWTRAMAADQSCTLPDEVGRLNSAPNSPSPASSASTSPITRSTPTGSARVRNTAMVWGCVS